MKLLFSGGSNSKKKRDLLFKGDSIPEFIEIYKKLPGIVKLIPEKDDSNGIWGLYKDFMKVISYIIFHDPILANFGNEQKEKVLSHIRNYIMFKLYPKYFL